KSYPRSAIGFQRWRLRRGGADGKCVCPTKRRLHGQQLIADDGRGQGGGAQEGAEREFVAGRVLAGELDVAVADHRAGDRSQDQGEQGPRKPRKLPTMATSLTS